MADVVQARLERMVPELDDLEARGLFTKPEIVEIVKKRRKLEYRLKRPSPLKQDFLEYIEYEKQLDRLRLLRKRSVSRELKEKGNKKMKKSVSDYAGARRIIGIYQIATSRFKGDLELWFGYLDFCKERQNGRMKKVLAQVMRFHPKVPAVWIYAAAWEYDHNLDDLAARAIMLSGLRACPTSEDLWVEYLRFELTFLNKLKMRKAILGEDEGALVPNEKGVEEKQWQDENQDAFMSLEDKKEDNNEESSKKSDFTEHDFSFLHAVYKGAIDTLPSSLNLRKRFLGIVETTNIAHSEELQSEILADIKRDFVKEPEYWDWLAQRKTNSAPDISLESGRLQVDQVIKVYEEAIQIVPSVMMFSKYIKFLLDIIPKAEETQYIAHLLKIFEKAETMGCLDEDLAHQHVMFYLEIGKFDEAMKLSEKYCEDRFSDAKEIWVLRVTEQMKHISNLSSPSKADLSSTFDLLKKTVKTVAASDVESLWLMAIELFANHKKYSAKLLDLSLVSLAKHGGSDNGFSLSATLVDFIHKRNGILKARDFYKRLISLPHPGLAIYKHCIDLEISTGDKDSLANARKLFQSALATYSQEANLWRDYYSLEAKMGTSETANAVYWCAKKTIGDASILTAPSVQ